MIVLKFFKRIGHAIHRFIRHLLPRLKPRLKVGWIVSAIIWLLVIVYLVFGILTAVWVYAGKSESGLVKTTVKYYPLPVATINGHFVWAKDYYCQLDYIRQFSVKTKQPIPNETALRQQIVDQLVENKTLELQATRYHVRVSSKDVNDAYQKIVDQAGGVSEVKKVLSELYGMSEKDFKELVRQQVLKEKIQNEVIAQVQVSHILIKDEARANDVANQAKNNGDFAALAKQYSEDSKSKDNGGELGYLAKGQLVVNDTPIPEFDNAAFSAKKGDIVGPVKTSIGFEIIKIEDKKGQISDSFDAWLSGVKKTSKIWRFIK
ncbi:TPA: hypothetical protein DD449_01855 [Candidatus Berkelbacteria bacterium]|uniref:Foldase protein PrsA n=1 Tax=Berkelbacteria bacterium GW2011_GWE1_39_12 TaxID=1618337 RepID=A0A0G4B668_9BACT|nr:MAG: Foldase protein PrsA [Berkelbacteria bacterium GW2011_GWE1_39_12]HBO60402.1 hypothetical protein [Candidatus Berkelbacteria bacterium]